jgi:hypothetical protein
MKENIPKTNIAVAIIVVKTGLLIENSESFITSP